MPNPHEYFITEDDPDALGFNLSQLGLIRTQYQRLLKVLPASREAIGLLILQLDDVIFRGELKLFSLRARPTAPAPADGIGGLRQAEVGRAQRARKRAGKERYSVRKSGLYPHAYQIYDAKLRAIAGQAITEAAAREIAARLAAQDEAARLRRPLRRVWARLRAWLWRPLQMPGCEGVVWRRRED